MSNSYKPLKDLGKNLIRMAEEMRKEMSQNKASKNSTRSAKPERSEENKPIRVEVVLRPHNNKI